MADRVIGQLSELEKQALQSNRRDRVTGQLSESERQLLQPVSPQATQPDSMDFSLPDYRSEFKPEDLGMLNALFRGGMSGLTFGAGHHLASDPEAQLRYQEALKQQNPWTYFAGEVLGAALPTLATGGIGLVGRAAASGAGWAVRAANLAKKFKSVDKLGQAMLNIGDRPIIGGILGMTGRGTPSVGTLARVGALSGGAHGFGSTEGGLRERLEGALQNAAVGGALAPALGGAITIGAKGAGWVGSKVMPRSGVREVGTILARTSEPDIIKKLRALEKDPEANVFDIKPDMATTVRGLGETNLEVQDILSEEFRKIRGKIGENIKDKIDDLAISSKTGIVSVPDSADQIRKMATERSQELYDIALQNPFNISDELYKEINDLMVSKTVTTQFKKAVDDLSDVASRKQASQESGYFVNVLDSEKYPNIPNELSKPLLDQLYKNLGDYANQVSLSGSRSQAGTIIGLQEKLRDILKRNLPEYKQAVDTHRANLLPADFLELGYRSFSKGSPDEMAFELKKILEKHSDVMTDELSENIFRKFREGFSAALRENLGDLTPLELPKKLMDLLDKPNFRKKFEIVFGKEPIAGMSKLDKLQKDVAEEFRKSKFFRDIDYKGMPEIDLREAFDVPTSNYQLVASLINTASELLTSRSEALARQKAIVNALLLKGGASRSETARKLRKETQKAFRRQETRDILAKSAVPTVVRYAPNAQPYQPPEQR